MQSVRKKVQMLLDERKRILQSRLRKEFGTMDKVNMGRYRRRLRREWAAARFKIKYQNDPAFRKREAIRSKKRRIKDPEKERIRRREHYWRNKATANARKADWARRSRDHVTAYRRKYYKENRASLLETIYAGRDRRDPSRVVRRIARELAEGRLDVRTAVERIREQVDALNGRVGDGVGPSEERGGRDAGGAPQDPAID